MFSSSYEFCFCADSRLIRFYERSLFYSVSFFI